MTTRDYLFVAVDIAREAGAVLADAFARGVTSQDKSEFDLVTEADHLSERLILDRLRQEFPGHAVIAEEAGAQGGEVSPYRWHVDPLDGTKNFARGYPAFSLSIALEYAGEPVVGVVFDPLRQELFMAERGAGAFRNNLRIYVSSVRALERALVATGFPSARRHRESSLALFRRLSMTIQGLRRTGSSALDLAYLACGRIDAFWDIGLNSWDVAAGLVLVTEAGGRCSDLCGDPFGIAGTDLLADNGAIHDAFVGICQDTLGGAPHPR